MTNVNRARIEIGSVDGSATSQPLYVGAVVTIADFGGEIEAPGW